MRIATAAEADADKLKMQIIDPPRVPQNPVGPKRALLLSGVLAVGLAGGIGLALLLVQFDYSFYSIDELRGLGLPVVGAISMLGAVASFRQRIMPAVTFGSALLLLCAVYGGLLWHMLHVAGAA
jgi:hypothetical protein